MGKFYVDNKDNMDACKDTCAISISKYPRESSNLSSTTSLIIFAWGNLSRRNVFFRFRVKLVDLISMLGTWSSLFGYSALIVVDFFFFLFVFSPSLTNCVETQYQNAMI